MRALHAGRGHVWLRLAALWLVILLAFAGFAIMDRAGWLAALLPLAAVLFVVVGWSQFAISNALHEATHSNLGEDQRDWLAALLTAWPIGFTAAYREVHLQHHRHFGDPVFDPDHDGYADFPRSRTAFVLRLAYNLSGIAALRQFFARKPKAPETKSADGLMSGLLPVALVQLAILAVLWLGFGTPFAYLLWILPLITVAKAFSSTRTFCEHGSPDGRPVLRTITGTPMQTAVMGLFGFDYHAEHHLWPTVPFASLPGLHARHEQAIAADMGRPYEEWRYEVFDGGHLRLLGRWFRDLPAFEGRNGQRSGA